MNETFDTLHPGQAMLLVNNHDPLPLRYQFELERFGIFTWDYIEQGPQNFRMKVERNQR